MSTKILLVLCAIICFISSLEAASMRTAAKNKNALIEKLDYEGAERNLRRARQSDLEDSSGEDSDEDDEEDDAESQHQENVKQQQAYEESVNDSQEGSDEEDNFEDDDDDYYFGRRFRRDAPEAVINNEIEENSKPSESSEPNESSEHKNELPSVNNVSPNAPTASNSSSLNTSVLILIRDAIKKVTELPNTQQVATTAQQYFQLFEHFLQQTIEQVIDDDDDDEDDVIATTITPEAEKETVPEISNNSDKPFSTESEKENVTETNVNIDKTNVNEISEKETSETIEHEVPKPEKKPEVTNGI